MQLQIKSIFSTRQIFVSLFALAALIVGTSIAAQKSKAPAAQKKPTDAPAAQKKQGDAGTELDAAGKPEQAMLVKLNTTHKGSLSASTDKEDIYKFQVKKGSPISIYVGNDPGSNATLFAEVLYADGKPLEKDYEADANPDPGEGEQVVIDSAPAATLLLRVRSEKGRQAYSFSITGKAE